MKRDIGVERLYPLGDFKNVKFSTVLKDVPEDLAKNEKVVGLLFMQQSISCEIAYRKYYNMIDRIVKDKIENVLEYLEQQREQTMAELYEEIQKSANKYTAKEYLERAKKETEDVR
jgi:hypothetical protein